MVLGFPLPAPVGVFDEVLHAPLEGELDLDAEGGEDFLEGVEPGQAVASHEAPEGDPVDAGVPGKVDDAIDLHQLGYG